MADMTTPQEVCVEAARIIERDGWHQGNFYKPPEGEEYQSRAAHDEAAESAPVCAFGSINRAATGNAVRGNSLAMWARQLLEAVLGGIGDGIPAWNDAPERSAEDVILALKHASQTE